MPDMSAPVLVAGVDGAFVCSRPVAVVREVVVEGVPPVIDVSEEEADEDDDVGAVGADGAGAEADGTESAGGVARASLSLRSLSDWKRPQPLTTETVASAMNMLELNFHGNLPFMNAATRAVPARDD